MMPQALDEARLLDLPRGSHVCWALSENTRYTSVARALIEQGRAANEKIIVFAPHDSEVLIALSGDGVIAVDPLTAFLGGTFDTQAMFGIFRQQDQIARSEGFIGLCIVADMDWMARAKPSMRQVIGYELLGDRLVRDLGATAICTYRASSFRSDIVLGAQAVHRFACGNGSPQFQLIAGETHGWALLGEVDMAVAPQFETAVDVAVRDESCVIDMSGVEFIDVGGMRTLARACAGAEEPVRFHGVSPALQRFWTLSGFDALVPLTTS